MNNQVKFVLPLVAASAAAAPWVVAGTQWHQLPPRVPLHYTLGGTPNRFGSPVEALIWHSVLPLLLTLIIFLACSRSIKRRPEQAFVLRTVTQILIAMNIVLAISSIAYVESFLGKPVRPLSITVCAVSLLISFVAFIAGRTPRNPVVGFRIKSTLASDEIWKKVNTRCSYFLAVACLAPAVVSFFSIRYAVLLGVTLLIGTAIGGTMYANSIVRSHNHV